VSGTTIRTESRQAGEDPQRDKNLAAVEYLSRELEVAQEAVGKIEAKLVRAREQADGVKQEVQDAKAAVKAAEKALADAQRKVGER
jgi:predicted  nucleic acid-binding Zn-ribbon protein